MLIVFIDVPRVIRNGIWDVISRKILLLLWNRKDLLCSQAFNMEKYVWCPEISRFLLSIRIEPCGDGGIFTL